MRKHDTSAGCDCPAIGCDLIGKKAPRRADKLYIHCYSKHSSETLLQCRVSGCQSKPMVPAVFILHVQNHEIGYHITNGFPEHRLMKIFKIAANKMLRCPLGDCKQAFLHNTDFGDHILTHDYGDRHGGFTVLATEGYNAFSGKRICPICFGESSESDEFASREDFAEHFIFKHMTLDPDHFRVWREAVESIHEHVFPRWYFKQPEQPILTRHAPLWTTLFSLFPHKSVACPKCGIVDGFDGIFRHQQSLMVNDWRYLKRYAAKILPLLPELGAHPFFDDFRPRDRRSICRTGKLLRSDPQSRWN